MLAEQGVAFYRNILGKGKHDAEELTLSCMRPGFECFPSSKKQPIPLDAIRGRTQEAILQTLTKHEDKAVIFSDENLCFLRQADELERVRTLFPAHVDIEVFLTLRDATEWGQSYRTQITSLHGRRLSDDPHSAFYVEPDSWIYDFDALKQAWMEAFGTVHIIHYDRDHVVTNLLRAMNMTLPPDATNVRINVTTTAKRIKATNPLLLRLDSKIKVLEKFLWLTNQKIKFKMRKLAGSRS